MVLLHGSCHNPSGVDPDADTWAAIAEVVVERELLPLVDFAYQGFGFGLREDADWLAGLARPGLEFLVCSSYSKNFALYNERVGALTIVAADAGRAASALSHLKIAIRSNYSNPPAHGADIVETILTRPGPAGALGGRAGRRCGTGSWATGRPSSRRCSPRACRATGSRFAVSAACSRCSASRTNRWRGSATSSRVYVVGRGRINVAGLTAANLPRVVGAVKAVIEG